MIIRCNKEQKQGIKKIISDESKKMGIPIEGDDVSDGIDISEIYPYCVDEDGFFEDWCLDDAEEGACSSPRELFMRVKERYPDVEIGGTIIIGDDNNRNFIYYYSPSGCKTVDDEYTFDGTPLSKCWYAVLTYCDYGPYTAGFVTKEEFEEFLKTAEKKLEQGELTFEEFLNSDEFPDFLDESGSFPHLDETGENVAFYTAAWKKYQSES